MTISAVLLASGLSRRYGSNKLLAEVDGLPLYHRAFQALPSTLFHRACVVSCYDEILAAAELAGYIPVRNPHPEEGQSSSLRLGLTAVSEGSDGVLFSVCDQPHLTEHTVRTLIDGWQQEPGCLTALCHQGRRGSPVIFPARFYPELMALRGDVGGSPVLKAHPDLVRTVEAPEIELKDMDRPGQLS